MSTPASTAPEATPPAATPPAATPPTPAPPATATPPATGDPAGDQLGEGGKKALEAERAARAKAEADYKALQKQIEDSKKSVEQKAADDLAASSAKAAEAEGKALRYEVAAEKGLDLALAARLTGSTREELEADAEKLMALIPKAPEAVPPAPPNGPTVPGQQPGSTQTPAQITQSDLDALGAAGKHEEINRLRREGRLSHLGVAPPKQR